jgi:Ribose/xylose/arabinose/galactoside ABC-type transport systems, permease components
MDQVSKKRKNSFAVFKESLLQWFKENLGIIIALVVLCLALSINPVTKNSFLTLKNVFNVLRQISSNLFLACGMTMVIILGGIDLSVGSVIALSGCIAAGAVVRYNLPLPVAIILGILVGLVVGMCNGLLYLKQQSPHLL